MDFIIACMPWVALFFGFVIAAIVILKIFICIRNNKQRKEYEAMKNAEAEKIEVLNND